MALYNSYCGHQNHYLLLHSCANKILWWMRKLQNNDDDEDATKDIIVTSWRQNEQLLYYLVPGQNLAHTLDQEITHSEPVKTMSKYFILYIKSFSSNYSIKLQKSKSLAFCWGCFDYTMFVLDFPAGLFRCGIVSPPEPSVPSPSLSPCPKIRDDESQQLYNNTYLY